MAYTFGGATGDDLDFSIDSVVMQDNRVFLLMGWWYPTTLTSGRYLWGDNGGFNGAYVHSTTSEIKCKTGNVTTKGEWVTSGAALATSKWSFLAFHNATENTGVKAAWRVWMGTEDSPPKLVLSGDQSGATIGSRAVAPAGNFAGTADIVLGNSALASTVAFQGDIDSVFMVNINTGSGNAGCNGLNPLLNVATGAIAAAEEDYVFRKFIYPFWDRGNPPFSALRYNTNLPLVDAFFWDGSLSTPARRWLAGTINANPALVPGAWNASSSLRRSPRRQVDSLNFDPLGPRQHRQR